MALDDVVKKVVLDIRAANIEKVIAQIRVLSNSLKSTISNPFQGMSSPAISAGFQGMADRVMQSQRNIAQQARIMKEQLEETGMQRLIKEHDSFAGSLRMGFPEWRKVNEQGRVFNSTGGKMGNQLRMLTHGMRGFRMEMLGVMFFGMMLTQTISGLLKPAMDATGMFELWGTMLMVLFLPIMIALLPYLISFMEWVINLPEGVKIAIGVIAILLLLLGGFLFLLGSIALGIGSLILSFALFGGVIAAIFWPVLAIIGILVVAIYGIYLAWKTNFGGIRDHAKMFFEALKMMWDGFLNVVTGVLDLISAIFSGDFEKVEAAMDKILKGIGQLFLGLYVTILKGIEIVALGIERLLVGAFETAFDFIEHVFVKLMNWLLPYIAKATDELAMAARLAAMIPGLGGLSGIAKGLENTADLMRRTKLENTPGFGINAVISGNNWAAEQQGFTPAFQSIAPVQNNTFNINVLDPGSLERQLEEHSRKQMEELRKLVPA
jgi:hypothetical protein